MNGAPTLSLDQVGRRFAGRWAVRALSLALDRGEILGLLGVNGAGKTTTLRMIAGVLSPDAGVVKLNGDDLDEHPAHARRHIGYLPETPPLHAELTADEFLGYCARLHGVGRASVRAAVDRAVERCELGDVRRRLLGQLSKGYRQRVGVAQAIVHEPALIVLDEPASGLDPVQALNLRALVRRLGEDHAVVLSTHTLPDVAACCDRVAILHGGQLRHLGRLHDARDALRVGITGTFPAQHWAALPMVDSAEPIGERHWRVTLAHGSTAQALASALVERGLGLFELAADGEPLEAAFLSIAAGDAAEEAA